MISELQRKRAITMYNGLSLDWDAIDETIRTQYKVLSDKEIAKMYGASLGQIQKRRFRVLGIQLPRGRPRKEKD